MTPFFSVILPSYNVEKYLDRCVKSFLAQSFTDYEIIIVDDGSTDRTGEIADFYVGKYDFIKCIHKANGGLSSARNAGIAEAKGQFIHMCDADDWVTPTFLEVIATKAIGDIGRASQVPDIVKFNYYRHVDGKTTLCKNILQEGSYDSVEDIDSLMKQALKSVNSYVLSAWSHIYRRDFLIENNLTFVSERKVGSEDFLFNLEALCFAKKVYAVNDACYYYDLRFGSLTQKYRESLPKQYVSLYRSFMIFIENSHIRNKHIDEFQNMFLWQLIFGTCFPNEYRKTENHSVADGRVRVKEICGMNEVQTIARKQLKTAKKPKRILYLLAFIFKQEWIFFRIFVGKKKNS